MNLPRRRRRLARGRAILALAACAALVPGAARAELALSAYGGASLTADNDLVLAQGGGTRLTFRGVAWAGESLQRPIYYGLRATWWLPRSPRWGIALDYTHVKMLARLHREVGVTGTRAGARVDGTELLGQTFRELGFSHGLNLATVSAVYRRRASSAGDPGPSREGGRATGGRFEPYALLGAGVTVPHVEVATEDAKAIGYQVAAPALLAGAGADVRVIGPVSALAEYRVSYARVKAHLPQGGSVEVHPWTSHFALGLSCAVR